MAKKTRGIITQVAKEDTYNVAPTFSDTDTIVAEKTDISPKIDTVNRKALSCSLITEAGLPVRFTASGSIALEMLSTKDENGYPILYGDVLYLAGLGAKNLATGDNGTGGFIGKTADGATDVNEINFADSTHAGDATIYTVSDGAEKVSLAVRKFYDSGDAVLLATGLVVSKTELNFNQADILSASFSLEGAGYTTQSGLTKPSCVFPSEKPFVGKNAVFTYKGNTVNAQNVSISIENKITSVESITTEGYIDKVIVEKTIGGQFTVLFEDFSYLDDLTNQTIGELFMAIPNGTSEIGVYLPRIKVSEVNINDNSNMLIEVTVSFTAEKDTNRNEVMYLGVK